MKWVKKLSKTNTIKSFRESLNNLISNPKIIIPFLIELLIPLIMAETFIYLLAGAEAYDFYYNPNVYLSSDSTLMPRIMIISFLSVIASIFIISYFDVVGILMLNNKRLSFKKALRQGKDYWVKQIITMLSIMLIGFGVVFIFLGMISLGLSYSEWFPLGVTLISIYFVLTLYPRIASVLQKGSGFDAVKNGVLFVLDRPLFTACNILVVIIVYGAFSWIHAMNPLIHQVINGLILFPWFNAFLVSTFKAKVRSK